MSVFNGKWRIDIGRGKKWDSEAGIYVHDDVGEEIISLRIAGGVQDYEVLYGNDPVIRMGYTSRCDDREWVPYAVRESITRPDQDETEAVAEFRDRIGANEGANARNFQVRKPYALVRTVYGDARTHYRISKTEDGTPQNVTLR
jgi:hypothetical protein